MEGSGGRTCSGSASDAQAVVRARVLEAAKLAVGLDSFSLRLHKAHGDSVLSAILAAAVDTVFQSLPERSLVRILGAKAPVVALRAEERVGDFRTLLQAVGNAEFADDWSRADREGCGRDGCRWARHGQ